MSYNDIGEDICAGGYWTGWGYPETLDITMTPFERIAAIVSFCFKSLCASDFFALNQGDAVRVYWAYENNHKEVVLDGSPYKVSRIGEDGSIFIGEYQFSPEIVSDWASNEIPTNLGTIYLFEA
jgi:hypothetical protein